MLKKAVAKSKFILFYACDTENLKQTKNRLTITRDWGGESS